MPLMAAQRRSEEGIEAPQYRVAGYATTFNEPYELYRVGDTAVYEQIAPDAFDGCDMSDVIMQFDHEGRVFARTSNGTLKLTIDEHGLLAEADLSRTESSRQLWEEIEAGLITRMSFCFTVKEHRFNDATSTDTITKIGKMYDVSAVSIPANPGTDISAKRKAFVDGVISEKQAERLGAEERKRRIQLMKLKIKLQEVTK